jgi:hypothetical protein
MLQVCNFLDFENSPPATGLDFSVVADKQGGNNAMTK